MRNKGTEDRGQMNLKAEMGRIDCLSGGRRNLDDVHRRQRKFTENRQKTL